MAGKLDLQNRQWCDLVFEDRNKLYGAYVLRRIYEKNILKGIVFAIIGFTLLVSAPLIMKFISDMVPEEKILKNVEVTTLAEPPPIDKNEPPPPPPPPPPPLKSTIKFTPPVIKKDEEVPDEPPPTQEKLQEVDAGAKTQEGDSIHGVDLGLGEGNEVVDQAPEQIFQIVEQMPSFQGGEAELFKYLQKNIKYPPIARENEIQGTVYVTFVIGSDGSVRDAKVLRGVGGGCDEEAIRVIKNMPSWKAGKQNGKAVSVQYNLPVRFTLR